MTVPAIPELTLNNGTAIPQLGFGVFKVDPDKTSRIVTDALEVGYRHIDTAKIYQNEEGVGHAIAESGIARDELFITTKLWNTDQADAEGAFEKSLARLRLDYVDLYLIHWPSPQQDRFVDAWKALERIAASGRAKAIGVSNFQVEHLQRLLDETEVVPAVNQIELHVDFQQRELREFHAAHGIATEAWGPLGQGKINDSPELAAIAEAHGKSVPQTILRWHLQIGNVVIPKSNQRERMAQNIDVVDFELSDDELATIAGLDRGEDGRNGSHPLEVN
ncbi:aldo/keto reductase [Humibacter sp. BT305]|uniref:2,5-diketo-D-gluconic acid reductase n=1 Tax=Cnuibacter physcomitrellae TaxID=1619308 RepID=A0A1X9LIX8_9MICO|nr:aldo/keto reductase [Cnuibacter physcomitrellae]ARJ05123.1 2,5-diketo-D-gluconic acid reductase [Cnuibacter physcomitrellae]AXH36226.1 aldo/keto reductase [Humibacter sp. BT305]MCS5498706.1 aldo/keto reductase [Cnuibacter physcomitrellae]GGI34999.1 2,5-diketo-D-gluconic acid reductase [Cnuibacter physcomitrellae]